MVFDKNPFDKNLFDKKNFKNPFDNLTKLKPLSGFPKFSADDDKEEERNTTTSVAESMEKVFVKPMLRMRNIFAAPLENIKEGLDDLKDLILPKSEGEVEFLSHAFEQHFVFQHLSSEEKRYLIGAMVHKTIAKDTTIIEQGQQGEYLYVINEGSVRFIVDGVEQSDRGQKGAVFGELSLLYDCPTAASVIAETECQVCCVSQNTFRRIKAAHAIQGDKEKRDTVVQIRFFKELPNDIIYQLADSLYELKFKKGDILQKKGTEGTTMYILKEGWVQGTDISVGTSKMADIRFKPGDHFGERAIVTGEAAVGTVVALTDGVAWLLSKERFQQTVGHLDLKDLVLKTQDKKFLSVIPLFAHSDVDSIEIELLAEKVENFEYKKGHVFATMGQSVEPAVYLIRKGSVTLSSDVETKTLTGGEVFGFGGQTMIVTNAMKEANPNEMTEEMRAAAYASEAALKANSVPAAHGVWVTEDIKVGKLPLSSIAKVLHDPFRLVRGKSSRRTSVQANTLEKRKVLGAGTFGIVWLTRHAASDSPYALKIQYKRQLIEFHQAKGVVREKNVMARMQHPFVMGIIHYQQDTTCLYMVMDFMQGGELGSVMHTRKRKHLAEGSARFYAAGVLEGLSYMHRRHYLYRDLKGENVLLDNQGYSVIVDLGFAKYVPDKTFTFCGTPLFIAPEIVLSKGHDKGADIWSYGVLLYEMLTGENPFYTDDRMDQLALFQAICKGKYTFPRNSHASADAQDLVKKLLVLDPKERLGCRGRADLEIRGHDWFQGFDWGALYRKELTPPWKPVIRDPFDGSNFGNWQDAAKEKETQKLKPLSEKEQKLFVEFGPIGR